MPSADAADRQLDWEQIKAWITPLFAHEGVRQLTEWGGPAWPDAGDGIPLDE